MGPGRDAVDGPCWARCGGRGNVGRGEVDTASSPVMTHAATREWPSPGLTGVGLVAASREFLNLEPVDLLATDGPKHRKGGHVDAEIRRGGVVWSARGAKYGSERRRRVACPMASHDAGRGIAPPLAARPHGRGVLLDVGCCAQPAVEPPASCEGESHKNATNALISDA